MGWTFVHREKNWFWRHYVWNRNGREEQKHNWQAHHFKLSRQIKTITSSQVITSVCEDFGTTKGRFNACTNDTLKFLRILKTSVWAYDIYVHSGKRPSLDGTGSKYVNILTIFSYSCITFTGSEVLTAIRVRAPSSHMTTWHSKKIVNSKEPISSIVSSAINWGHSQGNVSIHLKHFFSETPKFHIAVFPRGGRAALHQ
jgi:hypothetical protein